MPTEKYRLGNLTFEWDAAKAAANEKKHRAGFPEAATVFLDPRAVTTVDEAHSAAEDRERTVGFTLGWSLS